MKAPTTFPGIFVGIHHLEALTFLSPFFPRRQDLKEILGNNLAKILETALVQKGLRRTATDAR